MSQFEKKPFKSNFNKKHVFHSLYNYTTLGVNVFIYSKQKFFNN